MTLRVLAALLLSVPASSQIRVVSSVRPALSAPGLAAPMLAAPSEAVPPSPGALPVAPSAPVPAPVAVPVPAPASAAAFEEFALAGRELFDAARRAESRSLQLQAAVGEPASEGDLSGSLGKLPSTNAAREAYAIELLKLSGVKDEDIVRQDVGEGRVNIRVTVKGETERVIELGAHLDKVHVGKGTIDNGSGSMVIAYLAGESYRGPRPEATHSFTLFSREEEGLIGSRFYVRSLTEAGRKAIDAMLNVDTVGIDPPMAWGVRSTQELVARAFEAAKAAGLKLLPSRLMGGDSDSSSFRRAGIPAMTFLGVTEEKIFRIIHSDKDNMSVLVPAQLHAAYLVVRAVLHSLDRRPLGPVARP